MLNSMGRPILPKPATVFYGWWLVCIGAFTMAVVISPIFQGLGVFFVTLERQFGWSRATLAGAFSLARAEDTLIGPVAGYLTDRIGSRRMVFIGFLTLGVGYLLFSSIQNIAMFYAAFFVLTIGGGLAGFLPIMGAVNNWFVRRRATAMGITQSGINLGGALIVPALAWGVTTMGWRITAIAIAVIMFAVAAPLSAAIRNRPEDYGQVPDGGPLVDRVLGDQTAFDTSKEMTPGDFTLRQALRTSAFWLISFGHAFPAMVFVTLTIHTVPMVIDRGFSLGQAALVVVTFTTVAGMFQFLGGIIGDRVPKRLGIAVFISIQSLGVAIAALAQNMPMLLVFAVIFGVGGGGRVPLLIAIRGEYFGRNSFATIFGFSSIPISFVLIGGPVVVGYLVDQLGSYTVSLWGLAGIGVIGAVLIGFARRPRLTGS